MFEFMLTEGQRALGAEVRKFVAEKVSRQLILDMDAEKVIFPKDYVRSLADDHLLGLRFPAEYGGRGLNWADEVVALEEVGVLGTSLACLYSMPSIVGEAINAFDTTELREKYLRPTLEGQLFCAEALTEPRGGSDFFGTTTIARREGNYYYLTGQKRFIVGAEGADYFLVYAKTDPNGQPHQSVSAFIVDRGTGVRVEHLYGLMGTRGGGAGRVVFKDVRVPAENLLGRENGAAEIFYRMMIPERMTSAAGALGMARAALEVATSYSTKRKAFGRKIKDFQAVSFKVADSLTKLDAARSLVYVTARAVDTGVDPSLARRLVSECKKLATETAWEVVNHAMQIMGGIGYTNVYPVERMLRDIRLIMIWTGTNEIMDLIIQHEFYSQLKTRRDTMRDVEADATNADLIDEKVYE
ncbi:acyl-CoA dehydrogenase [Clostridiales bacterium PH28_bin88]|nr:acyl-CoA dehydrogenase [Clostridiales bacterium PH28_bin88]